MNILFVRNRQDLDNIEICVLAYMKDKTYNAKLNEVNKSRQDTSLFRGICEEVYHDNHSNIICDNLRIGNEEIKDFIFTYLMINRKRWIAYISSKSKQS